MKNLIKNTFKFIVPLVFGGGIVWYLYRGIKIEDIKEVINSGVKWEWILLSLFIVTLSHIIRAYRWKFQLKTLKVNPSVNTLVNSIFGGYSVNLLFPRLGEIWRCNYISKNQNIPFSTILGSLISERILDMVCMLLITVIAVISQFDFFLSFFSSHETIVTKLHSFITSPWPYIVFGAIITALFFLRKKLTQGAFAQKLQNILFGFKQGIKTILQMDRKWTYIFLTALIWVLYFFNFYVCLFAFDFTSEIGFANAITLFVMGSLAIIVPIQGGLGPWHFMIISTLMLFGVGNTQASTFAFVVHTFQQAVLIILGIYTIIAINLGEKLLRSNLMKSKA